MNTSDSNGVVVFEGDYVSSELGFSKVVEFSNYDSNGDADCHLENGKVVNTKSLTWDDIKLESELMT